MTGGDPSLVVSSNMTTAADNMNPTPLSEFIEELPSLSKNENPVATTEQPPCPPCPLGHALLPHFRFGCVPDARGRFYTNLNQGSFGACPLEIETSQVNLIKEMNRNPEQTFRARRTKTPVYYEKVLAGTESFAKFLHVGEDWKERFLLSDNTSAGVNMVLKSLLPAPIMDFVDPSTNREGEYHAVHFDTAYPMVKDTLEFLLPPTRRHEIKIAESLFALGTADAIESWLEVALKTRLDALYLTKGSLLVGRAATSLGGEPGNFSRDVDQKMERIVVVFSHITCVPALVFPAKKLCRVCRAFEDRTGIETIALVDGAHCPGQLVNLFLDELGADYWVGNGHKWLCTPVAVAAVYARTKKLAQKLQPLVHRSTGVAGFTPFEWLHSWGGTRDQSSWMCVGPAVEWICGPDKHVKYGNGTRRGKSVCVWGGVVKIDNELRGIGRGGDNLSG